LAIHISTQIIPVGQAAMSTFIQDERVILRDAGGNLEFACPRCGSGNLHHARITAYSRGEDAPATVRIDIEGPTSQTSVEDSQQSTNPSRRRDGIAIRFACEACCWNDDQSDLIELTIAQHKGSTEIAWRYTPKPPENSN
jgi:hypothetical protein